MTFVLLIVKCYACNHVISMPILQHYRMVVLDTIARVSCVHSVCVN